MSRTSHRPTQRKYERSAKKHDHDARRAKEREKDSQYIGRPGADFATSYNDEE